MCPIEILKPKRVFVVEDPEKLKAEAGFAGGAYEVEMMNLMMVEGSPTEGMDMEGASEGKSKK